jgi:formylglycine-generating enzyme required for sulfatase activity
MLDSFVSTWPEVASRTPDGFVMDYGEGTTMPGGAVWSGSTTVDASGINVTSAGISGTLTITHDNVLIEGSPIAIGSSAWTVDLEERTNGTVVGDITVATVAGRKSSGSLSGTIGIDTEICLEYPISGSLTATVDGTEITITFQPDCDGSVDHETGASGSPSMTFTLPGGVPLEMVPIPAGTFMMGAHDGEVSADDIEYPQHRVTLSQDFLMGKHEVTQAQWQAVMGSNPALEYDAGIGDSYPVYNVSWDDIAGPDGFIERLNEHLGTTTVRLPTEAEWEYAARAGTTTRFSHGNALGAPCDEECEFCELHDRHMLWCGNNELVNPENPNSTEPVGMRTPNPFGLYDVHGNISEWVNDWYVAYSADAQTDPTGPQSGSYKVFRGGDYGSDAATCRSANRFAYSPGFRGVIIGFRLAKSESP